MQFFLCHSTTATLSQKGLFLRQAQSTPRLLSKRTAGDLEHLVSVRLHVLVEVLLHVEVLATPLAHELLVPNVDAHVGAELVLVLEPLIAVLTSEGFLSRMLQGVHLE